MESDFMDDGRRSENRAKRMAIRRNRIDRDTRRQDVIVFILFIVDYNTS